VHLRGSLPLTSPGRRSVLVALTRGPLVKHPAELTKAELTKARVHTLAYPASSSRAACTLRVRLEPDALLSESVALTSSALACDFGD
jgi:hypothetical protein